MRISEFSFKQTIQEGGNIFKSTQGDPLTKPIKQQDIEPTLRHLEQITTLPLVNNILGSAGKKSVSGDIDVVVDPDVMNKDQLIDKLSKYVDSINGGDKSQWIKKSGISVHFRMPILNDPKNGFTQVDFMFHKGGPEQTNWMKFSMHSAGDASEYSGADRNLLMSSIAKAQGMKYSWQKGLLNRQDESVISIDPDQIAKKLLGAQHTHDVFDSVEQMQEVIHKNTTLMNKLRKLVTDLQSHVNPDGTPRKPGDIRKNQEEADRIRRLISLN